MDVDDQMPYIAGTILKGAMNAEKVPTKEKVINRAKTKTALKLDMDYMSNDPGTFSKNVYINTYQKFPKVNFVIEHGHTGATHYPVFQNSSGIQNLEFSPSVAAFIESKLDEYFSLLKKVESQELGARLLPKAVYYDMLLDLQAMGVDLDLLSPKAWKGGRKGIAAAAQHNGQKRIIHGTAWKIGLPDDPEGLRIIARNSYPSLDTRGMPNRLIKSANSFSRKVIGDMKHGTFENIPRRMARYPWVKVRAA